MFIDRPGARIFYEVEGEKARPLVTLLNGYGRSSTDFRALSKFLTEKGFQVLRLDNRGAGKTENEPGFTISDMTNDVVAIWDALGIGQSHLLGISYGGILSILIASSSSTRVRTLLLISTTPSSFFLGLDNDLSSQTPEQVEANLSRYFSPKFIKDNPILFRSLVKETSKAFLEPALRERTAQQRHALKRFDFTGLLHSILCPTLVLHGEADNVIQSEAAEVMGRSIKNAQVEIVPETGHLFLAEAPKFFYERMYQFLQKNP